MPAVSRRSHAAFTLVELLVVLAIAGLMAALLPPLLHGALPNSQVKAAARHLAGGLKTARTRAITSHEETVLVLDVDERSYAVGEQVRQLKLPGEVKLALVTADSELDPLRDSRGGIRFFPDGSSTGGRITLSYRQFEYQVDVNWLTGRVSILP